MMKEFNLKPLVAAMGLASVLTTTSATATVTYYDWGGFFSILDNRGAVFANSSINSKSANPYQTPITGTLAFDRDSGAGIATISASIAPFDFFYGLVELRDITVQLVGDGAGGEGSLMVGNMLADWSPNSGSTTTYGIPVSIVWDAAGLITGLNNGDLDDGVLDQADVAAYGAIPASDGTYTDNRWGYLGLGPVPIATTEWNLTAPDSCTPGDCYGVGISGVLPLIADNALNGYEYAMGDGVGIGGSPMMDGPVYGSSPNFDITYLQYAGEDTTLQIASFGGVLGVTAVPVPAAIWLFGSGLLGLIGVARCKKH